MPRLPLPRLPCLPRLSVLHTLVALPWLAACTVAAAAPAGVCQAQSPVVPPTVVELYTSEGCSSCPPADRWLSTLKGRPDVLALAFHVTYWDRLGWPDRFATPEATARQRELAHLAGSSQVYTPQVRVAGRDWQIWPKLPAPGTDSGVRVALQREGETVTAQIAAMPGSAAQRSGYWAVVEDGHQSAVKAGENAGETLHHDGVVRLYKPVGNWTASAGQRLQLTVSRGDPAYPRRVVFVVTDAATAQPLQAVALGC
jgi:hypothetical protein